MPKNVLGKRKKYFLFIIQQLAVNNSWYLVKFYIVSYQAEEAAEKTEEPKIVAPETPLTPDELLEQELQHVIRISLEESANGNIN